MKPAMHALAGSPGSSTISPGMAWSSTPLRRDPLLGDGHHDAGPGLGYPNPGSRPGHPSSAWRFPKEEQDSNWMLRAPCGPPRSAMRRGTPPCCFPLLRRLADEADTKRSDPQIGPASPACLRSCAMWCSASATTGYPDSHPVVEKVRAMGLGRLAEEQARRLSELRLTWGLPGRCGRSDGTRQSLDPGAGPVSAPLQRPRRSHSQPPLPGQAPGCALRVLGS